MPEIRVPIARKQHAQMKAMLDQIAAIQSRLSTAADTLVGVLEEDLPPARIVGVDDTDGIYVLVLDVPEPPQAAE